MPTKIAPPSLTLRQINRATLARQMLLAREQIGPVAAIERLAGMQAQQPRPPFVGLWTRLENFQREDLCKLLLARNVVRVTAMRGTLHLMSAADYIALRPAIQPALTKGMQSILRERVSSLDIDALHGAAKKFFGKAPASFDALRDHFKMLYPDGDERAMAFAIRMHLPLVQVPIDTPWAFPASADFAMAEPWLNQKLITNESPPHALLRRYLAAFGPATPADAQAWSGLQGLRAVFDEMRANGEVITFSDERKRELFDLPDAPRPAEDTPAPIRFVPDFDNLVLAHADRTRIIDDAHRGKVVTKNLLVRATFLVDGFVAGTWKIERKKKSATLILEPFAPLPKKTLTDPTLNLEAQALLRFVEPDAETYDLKVE